MLGGYAFWLILSKITTTDIVGTASTVVSIATILTAGASLGIPIGVQRFLGKYFLNQELATATIFIKASIFLSLVGTFVCCSILLVLYIISDYILSLSLELVIIACVITATSVISALLRFILISALQTRLLPVVAIVSTLTRIVLAFALLAMGLEVIGVTTGFAAGPLLASILLLIVLTSFLKVHEKHGSNFSLTFATRQIFVSSAANWIPAFVYTLGTSLGPILIFGTHGAGQAGIYFIAFSLVTAISASVSSLFSIVYPTLSAMKDGRKRYAWRATKVSLIITIPFSFTLLFYAQETMAFFGSTYIKGELALEILLFSLFPIIVTTGVTTLVYSYGMYKKVLLIGLGTNLPRVLLYLLLVPADEDAGAALSFTIGSYIGLFVTVLIAERVGLKLYWRQFILIPLISVLINFGFKLVGVNLYVSIPVSLIIIYVILIKANIITPSDIRGSSALIPSNLVGPMKRISKYFSR